MSKWLRKYLLKFNVAILNRLKIMRFLKIQRKYIYIMSILENCGQTYHYFGKFFFPNLNPTSSLNNILNDFSQ